MRLVLQGFASLLSGLCFGVGFVCCRAFPCNEFRGLAPFVMEIGIVVIFLLS